MYKLMIMYLVDVFFVEFIALRVLELFICIRRFYFFGYCR